MAEKLYYMPLNLLIPQIFYSRNQLRKKYVSMYQSINLYKEKAGIRCLGNVESVSIVTKNKKCYLQLPMEVIREMPLGI